MAHLHPTCHARAFHLPLDSNPQDSEDDPDATRLHIFEYLYAED